MSASPRWSGYKEFEAALPTPTPIPMPALLEACPTDARRIHATGAGGRLEVEVREVDACADRNMASANLAELESIELTGLDGSLEDDTAPYERRNDCVTSGSGGGRGGSDRGCDTGCGN